MNTEPNVASSAGVPELSDPEFMMFRKFIQQETGICLDTSKKEVFTLRLSRRMRQIGYTSYGEYYRLIHNRNAEEMSYFLECICIHETYFFREPDHFRFLQEKVYPVWDKEAKEGRRAKQVRAWSVACSTGEEAYSLGMTLLEAFPPPSWQLEVLATDISTHTLELARKGVWPVERSVQHIPQKYLKAYMLRGKGNQQGLCKATPELSSIIRLDRINLNDHAYLIKGLYDIIFCRHVVMYFDQETMDRVIHQLCRHLAPNGYLFLGETELFHPSDPSLKSVAPSVYFRAGDPPASSGAKA